MRITGRNPLPFREPEIYLFPVVHWAPLVVGVKSVTSVWVANELKGLASAWVQATRPAEVLTAGGRRGGKVDMARGTWRQS